MRFTGKLLKEGRVVVDPVVGQFGTRTDPDDGATWSGSFFLLAGRNLAGGTYDLHLDDGRCGVISLAGVAAAPDQPALVPFASRGPSL